MARKQADPFGFLGAINWDVVDDHADEIAAVFNVESCPQHPYDRRGSCSRQGCRA